MNKFLRVTDLDDNTVVYIPIHSIKEISVDKDFLLIEYGKDSIIPVKESEAEIAKQINQ